MKNYFNAISLQTNLSWCWVDAGKKKMEATLEESKTLLSDN